MFKIGQIVEHHVFGKGKIIKMENEKLTIKFSVGLKIITKKYFTKELTNKINTKYLHAQSNWGVDIKSLSDEIACRAPEDPYNIYDDDYYEEMYENAKLDYGYLEDEEFGPEDGYYGEHELCDDYSDEDYIV